MPVKIVAPVVVKPEIDSNKASVKDKLGESMSIKGTEPNSPSTDQNKTVMIKPSRILSSLRLPLKGNHMQKPPRRLINKAYKKAWVSPS